MKMLSRERWTRLWNEASGQGDGRNWFEILAARYAEPQRHYHTAHHIAECLTEFDPVRCLASEPVAVELAIWFHDAVYDTHATDNEEQSAGLAEQCLADAGASRNLRIVVHDLILATKLHDSSNHVDTPLLLDIDLSILGQPQDRFWEYEGQIRAEYAWVPEGVFTIKRAEILERFLSRDRIYTTNWFYQRYEMQARSNLRSSLQQLRPGP